MKSERPQYATLRSKGGEASSGIFRGAGPRGSVWALSATRFGCGGTTRAPSSEAPSTWSRRFIASPSWPLSRR